MELWFISDTHFDHENILTFKRPDGSPLRHFSSITEMNETMIEAWNARVRPSDHIYHLGDVTMARGKATKSIDEIMARLNGHKRICLGNHDHLASAWYFRQFEKVKAYNVLDGIFFSHIPIHPGSLGRFRANVHGHIHANPGPGFPYLNISVEVTNYRPVNLEEIRQSIQKGGPTWS